MNIQPIFWYLRIADIKLKYNNLVIEEIFYGKSSGVVNIRFCLYLHFIIVDCL